MSRYQIISMSGLQRLNAETLQRAQQEAAYATLHVQAKVNALEELRAREDLHEAGGPVCPYVMRAAALTLHDFPRLNAQLSSEGLCVYEEVSLGLMVARGDGVLVPAVQEAGQKAPAVLAREAGEVTRQAHEGQIHRHKTRRPTFTIVDLSDYAVDYCTPILPLRSVGILGIGRVNRRFRPGAEGRPRVAAVQALSLTFDHRAADGLYAARFLTALVRCLEQPEVLQPAEETTAGQGAAFP